MNALESFLAATVLMTSHATSEGNTGELSRWLEWKLTSSSLASGVHRCSFTVTCPGLQHLLPHFCCLSDVFYLPVQNREMLESRACSCIHTQSHDALPDIYQRYELIHPTTQGSQLHMMIKGRKKRSKPLLFYSTFFLCSTSLTSPLQVICI